MLNSGNQKITDKLIFHYDMRNQLSYIGEPTYNLYYDVSIYLKHYGTWGDIPYAGYDYLNSSVYRSYPALIGNRAIGVYFAKNSTEQLCQLNPTTKYITVSFLANNIKGWESSIGNNDKGYIRIRYNDDTSLNVSNFFSYYITNVTDPSINKSFWTGITSNNFNYYELRYKLNTDKPIKGIDQLYIYNDFVSTGCTDFTRFQIEELDHATPYTPDERSYSLFDTVTNKPIVTDNIRYIYNDGFYFNESRLMTNNFNINSSNWSIEFIIKPYNASLNIPYVIINPSNGKYNEISLLNTGIIKFNYGDTSLYTYNTKTPIDISVYNMFHLTYDNNNVLSTYINGKFDSSSVLSTTPIMNNIWNIGLIVNPGNYRAFNGEIPLVSVYNKLLTPNETYINYTSYESIYNI